MMTAQKARMKKTEVGEMSHLYAFLQKVEWEARVIRIGMIR
jgi:hypothetical protein